MEVAVAILLRLAVQVVAVRRELVVVLMVLLEQQTPALEAAVAVRVILLVLTGAQV